MGSWENIEFLSYCWNMWDEFKYTTQQNVVVFRHYNAEMLHIISFLHWTDFHNETCSAKVVTPV